MRDLAVYADAGPWESLWVYDHFHTVPMPTDEGNPRSVDVDGRLRGQHHQIKLGQMCTAMSYRNPAYLAKVAATTDVISGGRVQMGIGVAGTSTSGGPTVTGSLLPAFGWRASSTKVCRSCARPGQRESRFEAGSIRSTEPSWRLVRCNRGHPIVDRRRRERVTLKIAARYAQYTNFTAAPAEFACLSQRS